MFTFNVVLQVLASKTKIYMVLEYVHGGELFDKIVSSFYAEHMLARTDYLIYFQIERFAFAF